MRQLLLLIGATVCGFAWGHEGFSWLLGLSALVPVLWHQARTRWAAAAVALAYYLAASRALPASTGIFFAATEPTWYGWLLWVAVAALNSAVWAVLWSVDAKRRLWHLPVILAVTALPPIGILGWANPLTAAGIFFPAMGFTGLVFFVALMVALMDWRPPVLVMLAGAVVFSNISVTFWPSPSQVKSTWSAANTNVGKLATGSMDFMAAYTRLTALQRMADKLPAGRVLVLPETFLGRFTPMTESFLVSTTRQLQAKGSTILVGAELPASDQGMAIKNALVAIGIGQGSQLVQRVPIPLGMWKPWAADSVVADPLASGIGTVAGRKVAHLICYEQILVFPVLASMLHSPDVVVGASNAWWARETSVPTIQGQALDLWGRLFAVHVVRATNI